MKEIVVISGKGGTGKTSITAALGVLGADCVVIADCDVDAADMHMLMSPKVEAREGFLSGAVAMIDEEACIHCGRCARVCRFDAIPYRDGKFVVEPLDCEGCGYCERICPAQAIRMEEQEVGTVFYSETRYSSPMVHAALHIGAENSGKLVAKVKREAKRIAEKNGREVVLVDGSPGIGCPVVSSLTGADRVLLVTEPTVSGLHDLKRVHEVVKRFQIPAACLVNKADLNAGMADEIHAYLAEEHILHLGDIPYDEAFTKSMVDGRTIVETDGHGRIRELLQAGWERITGE